MQEQNKIQKTEKYMKNFLLLLLNLSSTQILIYAAAK